MYCVWLAAAQAAALLGVGLLYERTCHRHMAEVMLGEMGCGGLAPPDPQHGGGGAPGAAPSGLGPRGRGGGAGGAGWGVASDREGHALAAGFALGFITLGMGRQAAGLHDLGLEARLR